MGRGEKLLLALAALTVLALALLAAYRQPPPSAGLRKRCEVTLNVKGRGLLLANASIAAKIRVTPPSRLVLRALPERGWRLARWLVNGSNCGSSPTLELEVRGNTTVTAIFKRILCSVRITSETARAEVYVNGSKVSLPYEAIVPWGSLIVIEARAPEGFEPDCWLVNGSRVCAEALRLRIKGNTTIEALFKRVAYRVVVVSPHPVYVNGLRTYGYSDYVRAGSELNITAPAKVKLEFNGSHEIYDALAHFLVNEERAEVEARGEYATLLLKVDDDVKVEAVYEERARRLTGNATVIADGKPYPANITRVRERPGYPGEVKVEGEWIEIRGFWTYYLTLPENWKIVKIKGFFRGKNLDIVVYLNETYGKGLGPHPGEFEVVFYRSPFKRICAKGHCSLIETWPYTPVPTNLLEVTLWGYVRFKVEVVTGE